MVCVEVLTAQLRAKRAEVARLQAENKTIKLLMIGRKSADALRREFGDFYIDRYEGLQGTAVNYSDAVKISEAICTRFEAGEFDVCTLIFNKFKNAITQEITVNQLIPAEVGNSEVGDGDALLMSYEYEPEEDELLASLLPRNLSTQIYGALLESSAAELAARMTAMDNATRNAGELIDRLTLVYNRTRQANITSELIEIISGAEAV